MRGNMCNTLKNLEDNVFSSIVFSKPCIKPIQHLLQNKHFKNVYGSPSFVYTADSLKMLNKPYSLNMFFENLKRCKITVRKEAKIRRFLKCLEEAQIAYPDNWVAFEMVKIKLLDRLDWKLACKHLNKLNPSIEIKRRYTIYLKKMCGRDYVKKLLHNINYLLLTYIGRGNEQKLSLKNLINGSAFTCASEVDIKTATLEEPIINYLFKYNLSLVKKKVSFEERDKKKYSNLIESSSGKKSLSKSNQKHEIFDQNLVSLEKQSNYIDLYNGVTNNQQVYNASNQEFNDVKPPRKIKRKKDIIGRYEGLTNKTKFLYTQEIRPLKKLSRNLNTHRSITFRSKNDKLKSIFFYVVYICQNNGFPAFDGLKLTAKWLGMSQWNKSLNHKNIISAFDPVNDNFFKSVKPINSKGNLKLLVFNNTVPSINFFIKNQKKTGIGIFLNTFHFKHLSESFNYHKITNPLISLRPAPEFFLPVLTRGKVNRFIQIYKHYLSKMLSIFPTIISATVCNSTIVTTKSYFNTTISSESISGKMIFNKMISNDISNSSASLNLVYRSQLPGAPEFDFFVVTSASHNSVPVITFLPTMDISEEANRLQEDIKKLIEKIHQDKGIIAYLNANMGRNAIVNTRDMSDGVNLMKLLQLRNYFDLYISRILSHTKPNYKTKDCFGWSRQVDRTYNPILILSGINRQLILSSVENCFPLLAFLKEVIIEQNVGHDLEIQTLSGSSISSCQSNLSLCALSLDMSICKTLLMMHNDLRLLKKMAASMYRAALREILPERLYRIKESWKAIAEKISVLKSNFPYNNSYESSVPVKLKFNIAKLKRSGVIKKILALYDSYNNILKIVIRLVWFSNFSSDLDVSLSSGSFSKLKSKDCDFAPYSTKKDKLRLNQRCYSCISFNVQDIERNSSENVVRSISESLSTEKTPLLLTKKFKKIKMVKTRSQDLIIKNRLEEVLGQFRNKFAEEAAFLKNIDDSTISLKKRIHPLLDNPCENSISNIVWRTSSDSTKLSSKCTGVSSKRLEELFTKSLNIDDFHIKSRKQNLDVSNIGDKYCKVANWKDLWGLLLFAVKAEIPDKTGTMNDLKKYVGRIFFEKYVVSFIKKYFKMVKSSVEQRSSEEDSEDSLVDLQELQHNTDYTGKTVFGLDSDEDSQWKGKKKMKVVVEVPRKKIKRPFFKKHVEFLTRDAFSNLRNILRFKHRKMFRFSNSKLEHVLKSKNENIVLAQTKEKKNFEITDNTNCKSAIMINETDEFNRNKHCELPAPFHHNDISDNEKQNTMDFKSNNYQLCPEGLFKEDIQRHIIYLSEYAKRLLFWKVATILQLCQSIPLSTAVCYPEFIEVLKETLGLNNTLEYKKGNRVNLLSRYFYKRNLRFVKRIINMQVKAENFFELLKTNFDSIGSGYSLVEYIPFKFFLEERLRKLYLILKTKEDHVLTRLGKLGRKFVMWSTTEKIDVTKKVVNIFKLELNLFELRAKLGKLAGMVNMKNVKDILIRKRWSIFCIRNIFRNHRSYSQNRSIKKYEFEKSIASALPIFRLFLLEKLRYSNEIKEFCFSTDKKSTKNFSRHHTDKSINDKKRQVEAGVLGWKCFSKLRNGRSTEMIMKELHMERGSNHLAECIMYGGKKVIFNSSNILKFIANLRPKEMKRFFSYLLKSLKNIRLLINDVMIVQPDERIDSDVSEVSYSSQVMHLKNLKKDNLRKRIRNSLLMIKSDKEAFLKCVIKRALRIFPKNELEERLHKYLLAETESKLSPLYLAMIDQELCSLFLNEPKYSKLFYDPFSEDLYEKLMGMMLQDPYISGRHNSKGIDSKTSNNLFKVNKIKEGGVVERKNIMSDMMSCKSSENSDSISSSDIDRTTNGLIDFFPDGLEVPKNIKFCVSEPATPFSDSSENSIVMGCGDEIAVDEKDRKAWLNTYHYMRRESILCVSAKRERKNHYFGLLMKLFGPVEALETIHKSNKPEVNSISFKEEKFKIDPIRISHLVRKNVIDNHISASFGTLNSRNVAMKCYENQNTPLLARKSYRRGEMDTFKNIDVSFYRWKRIVNAEEGCAYIRFLNLEDRSNHKFILERLWTDLLYNLILGRRQSSKRMVIPKDTGCWKILPNRILQNKMKKMNDMQIPNNSDKCLQHSSSFINNKHKRTISHNLKGVHVFKPLKNFNDTHEVELLFGRHVTDKSTNNIPQPCDLDGNVSKKEKLHRILVEDFIGNCYSRSWRNRSKNFSNKPKIYRIPGPINFKCAFNHSHLFACNGKSKIKIKDTIFCSKHTRFLPPRVLARREEQKQLCSFHNNIYDFKQDRFSNLKKNNLKLSGLVLLHGGQTYNTNKCEIRGKNEKYQNNDYSDFLPKFRILNEVEKLWERKKRWCVEEFNFYHWAFTFPVGSAAMGDFDKKVKEYLVKVGLPLFS